MAKVVTTAVVLAIVLLAGCSPVSNSHNIVIGPGGKYQLITAKSGCHTEDIILTEFPYTDPGQEGEVTIYHIKADGNLVRMVKSKDAGAGNTRMLKNGNYVTLDLLDCVVEIDYEGNTVRKVPVENVSHQVIELDNGHLLVCQARSDKFSEIDWEGNIYFEWKATDHFQDYTTENYVGFELFENYYYELQTIYTTQAADWTHLNFAQQLKDGNYIVSLRNLDLVVEVDHNTGDIIWSFGAGILKHQHTPVVYGKYMYVLDNGNGRVIKVDRQYSKIVWEYDGLYCPALGDIRKLGNGNLLITDSMHYRVIEVTEPEGEIVWELRTSFIPYRAWAIGTW